MKPKILVGALAVGLVALFAPTLHASGPAPLPSADEVVDRAAVEEIATPEVCDVTDQAIATGGIGCITCGTDEWCDNWCGPGMGRCAQNLSCGIFYKKFCYCFEPEQV